MVPGMGRERIWRFRKRVDLTMNAKTWCGEYLPLGYSLPGESVQQLRLEYGLFDAFFCSVYWVEMTRDWISHEQGPLALL